MLRQRKCGAGPSRYGRADCAMLCRAEPAQPSARSNRHGGPHAMFPLGSVSRSITSIPFITVLIILANAGVFYLEMTQGDKFIDRWSAVPAAVMAGREYETILTSAFMHAGWVHIIGNMVFLWAFAPPMEEAMGSIRFL